MNNKVVMAGLVASIAMAMVSMLYEAFWGTGFWAPPTFIAATIFRGLQTVVIPVTFMALPVVVGMIMHMAFSVALGSSFVAWLGKYMEVPTIGAFYGAGFGFAVFLVMWFVGLPLIDPVMLNLNPFMFLVAHLVWGCVLGITYIRSL